MENIYDHEKTIFLLKYSPMVPYITVLLHGLSIKCKGLKKSEILCHERTGPAPKRSLVLTNEMEDLKLTQE